MVDETTGNRLAGTRIVSGKRTTIYDLAALAGASPSAVSSVLNGTWKKRRISAALAERITRLADEHDFAINMQASALRREKSNLIGMIVPKYDNRYFGLIVEQFEEMARAKGLFPIITCTRRDPDLEVQAARAMISHQVDCLIATGATDPDRISELCASSGVRAMNLDLPGTLAPSVISDNYGGALVLTRRILADSASSRPPGGPILFVGGRITDHSTSERLRGFRDAHAEAGIAIDETMVLTPGYAQEKAHLALKDYLAQHDNAPKAIFVTSTITLEGVLHAIKESRLYDGLFPSIGCFDWDPLVAALDSRILMVRQDVPSMLKALFDLLEAAPGPPGIVSIPTLFDTP
ncbi:substrate-binding domain-containing protein [Paracoccus sp. (in: a-proteobacteria)]|uniref:substrate-binding domain-containing protein n=1 Tax=Paracoccus sp. TaxID=267 RepID=UPI0028AC7FF4|nr:substrate-binding domain-containing protein [Paracoccus sp. (in: a-proteobacteria)]